MQTGLKYRFRARSKNNMGWSEFSNTLMVGLGPKPSKLLAPTKSTNTAKNSAT